MAKVRPKKHAPFMDMTAMCDVGFLLLTFFIMTATFKNNAAEVTPPTSISEFKVPDDDLITITIDPKGKILFGIDGLANRAAMLDNFSAGKNLTFTPQEKAKFANQGTFGVPLKQMKSWLGMSTTEMAKVNQPGIPVDSTGDNELAQWVYAARQANPKFRIVLKGDNAAKFPVFKDVLTSLQSQDINKFSLVTGAEEPPKNLAN